MKKLYLRIQALVLVILIIVTTFVVNPQQVQADATVTADEESIPDLSTAESQSDSEQPETEPEITENTDVFPESANEANPETDIIPVNESSDIALITEAGTDDKAPEPAVEPTTETETETNPSASPSEQTIDKVDEVDTSSGVDTVNEAEPLVSDTEEEPATESISECEDQSTESDVERSEEANEDMNLSIETTEPEQESEDVVTDNLADQNTEINVSAENSKGTRAYTDPTNFEFDPATGTITKYIGTDPIVNIPSSINGVKVKHIGDLAFAEKELTFVSLPYTIETIGESAFGWNSLSSITLPDSVTRIGDSAFDRNKLSSITIPAGVEKIAHYSFANNQLAEITLQNGVTEIDQWAFKNNKLKTVKIPDTVINIRHGAFQENLLESIELSAGITEIGSSAFEFNKLTNVEIPNSVTKIGHRAFRGNLLEHVTIPNNVKSIGNLAFSSNQLTSLTLGNSVVEIGDETFIGNNLTSVTIPNKVTTIGREAFSENELTSLTLGNSVVEIGDDAFFKNHLTNLTIPDSVKKIGKFAFMRNELSSLTLGRNVEDIGVNAFFHNNLENLTIPNSVKKLGVNAFKFNQLNTVTISGTIEAIMSLEDTIRVSNPSITKIKEICFDDGVTIRLNRYIKAGYNIRCAPTSSDDHIIEKSELPIYATGTIQGNYFNFTYNSQTAYVHKSAITTIPQPITGYTKSTANVRSSPNGNIIGSLSANERVSGTLSGNWVKFTYSGQTGYIYASLLKAPVTRYVKAGSNIRRTPTGTIIERLKMPIFVTGTIAGNYLKFIHKGQTAYVHVNLATTVSPPITGYAKQKINVRSAPNGSVIGSLSKGRKVSGSLVGNWVRFTYSGNNGYVYSSLLQADPVKLTCYVKAGSNIRSVSGGTIIARLKMPIFVTGTISGNTLRFTYKGKAAYVAMSVITSTSPPITGYTKSTVNVRSTPNGSVIGTLPANRKVSGVLVGQWVKFTYSGRTGYISASLLK